MGVSTNQNSGNAATSGDGGRTSVASFGEFLSGFGNNVSSVFQSYYNVKAARENSRTSTATAISPVSGVDHETISNENARRGFSFDNKSLLIVGGLGLALVAGVYLVTKK